MITSNQHIDEAPTQSSIEALIAGASTAREALYRLAAKFSHAFHVWVDERADGMFAVVIQADINQPATTLVRKH